MQNKKIRVLIVDDSAFMRKAIKGLLESEPEIEVVGAARDGMEGVEQVMALSPDVVTLDIEMPRMNGLEALKVIMEKKPTPVLMLSSLTAEGAQATFDALEFGALDYIPKNLGELSVNIVKIKDELISKIKTVSRKKLAVSGRAGCARHLSVGIARPVYLKDRFVSQKIAVVAIGASTGGPMAVQDVLTMLPHDFPAGILIVQHMPVNFTGPYAERLNSICNIEVKEASNGDTIKAGRAIVAPGGVQTRLKRKNAIEVVLSMDNNSGDSIYKPSVDISFLSVAECFPGRALGVIMTGMGSDGREGIRAIKKTGGKSIAQDEASCVVYGMPKAVVDEGLADKVVALDEMAGAIVNMV
ncbi:MAG: chemotaxis response regulator protein-glutamate methylesterase [Deltaproteobacteria bacterium]|nr:chemotaxis response regulator protein-glutamate methylesterase [Deltaproteobacteria bacterium]